MEKEIKFYKEGYFVRFIEVDGVVAISAGPDEDDQMETYIKFTLDEMSDLVIELNHFLTYLHQKHDQLTDK